MDRPAIAVWWKSLLAAVALVPLAGCVAHPPSEAEPLVEPECQHWRLTVANTTQFAVRVFASGGGPEVFLGGLGPGERRVWILAAEPERIVARDQLRGDARGVEVRTTCVGR